MRTLKAQLHLNNLSRRTFSNVLHSVPIRSLPLPIFYPRGLLDLVVSVSILCNFPSCLNSGMQFVLVFCHFVFSLLYSLYFAAGSQVLRSLQFLENLIQPTSKYYSSIFQDIRIYHLLGDQGLGFLFANNLLILNAVLYIRL